MLVIIDGTKRIYAQNVTVIHRDQTFHLDGNELPCDLNITHTGDGIVLDVINADGEVAKTAWHDNHDLIGVCH